MVTLSFLFFLNRIEINILFSNTTNRNLSNGTFIWNNPFEQAPLYYLFELFKWNNYNLNNSFELPLEFYPFENSFKYSIRIINLKYFINFQIELFYPLDKLKYKKRLEFQPFYILNILHLFQLNFPYYYLLIIMEPHNLGIQLE